VLLRAEKLGDLNPAEADALSVAFYRPAPSGIVTIASGIITIPGSGCYRVAPQSGITDDLTGIVLSAENVDGATIHLEPSAAGQTIVVRHQGNFHLLNGEHAPLQGPFSGIWMRHKGSGVWCEWISRVICP
jgi:hypothetical protein